MSDFYPLQIRSVEQLTPSAVALTFEVPESLKDTFAFKAGQYITIKKTLDGQELRRAYSISSAPSSGELTVGIKKMAGGTFSVYANTDIKEGDVLEVMPPEGRFVFEDDDTVNTVGAFAAGSGITPIMSIAETVLERNEANRFVLVFGNQSSEESMYRNELLKLQERFGERFFVQWVYSRASESDALFGRIEPSTVNLIIKNKFKNASFDRFYLCGPEAMIHTVSDTLQKNDIPKERILFELFTSSGATAVVAPDLDGKTAVEVVVDDETHHLTMNRKDRVLDALLNENIDAPYSCQGGVCSSCIARVIEGKAEMVQNQILTDGEIEEGLILACQALPLTPTLKIDFDDV